MILLADGFDHYGDDSTGRDNMLDGVYAAVDVDLGPRTANARSGSHAFGSSNLGIGETVRRVIPGSAHNNIGFGCAQFFTNLPVANDRMVLWEWLDIGASEICSVVLQSTGDIHVKRGDHEGTLVANTTSAAIVAGSYQHIEGFFTFAGGSGAVEIRVNGVTVIDETSVDIGAASTVRQWRWGSKGNNVVSTGPTFLEDVYVYDNQGSFNNAIGVGDLKLDAIYPNADTAQSDWTRSGGSADYEMIDETAQDGDTTYVSSSNSNDISEFELQDVAASAESIKFLATYTYARKTDAGAATIQAGVGSADVGSPPVPSSTLGDSHALSEVYTYYMDIFESDPATGVAFTPSAVDDARLILKRV